jgi:hypothetical protein
MEITDEQRHAGWQELRQGPNVGWDDAAINCADRMYPEGITESDQEARQLKIQYVGNFMRKVVAAPLEPVVFYRPGYTEKVADENIHFFHVVTPDPELPVDFMYPSDDSERSAVLRLRSFSKDVGKLASHTVHASFDTTVDTRPDSHVKVWFGIGTQDKNVSPDLAYDYRDLGVQVAVGSKESGELFSSLRTDDSVRNGRLFGAIFNIAWMADELGIKPTTLGDFGSEKQAAIESVHVKRSGARSLVESSAAIFKLLVLASQGAANQAEIIQSMQTMHSQSIGDVYFQDLYPSREVADEVTNPQILSSKSLQRHVEQQNTSMRRVRDAIESYDKQLRILNSIVN